MDVTPKSFDKVWHDDLFYKLKAYGVEDELEVFCLFRNSPKVQTKNSLNSQTSEC